MSKRLNKRQLREQQELEQLSASVTQDSVQGSSSDHDDQKGESVVEAGGGDGIAPTAPPSSRSQSVFAALADETQDSPDEDDGDDDEAQDDITATAAKKKKKSKKRKKRKGVVDGTEGATTPPPPIDSPVPPQKSPGVPKRKPPQNAAAAKAKGRKENAAGGKTKGVAEMSMDELTALLSSQADVSHGQEDDVHAEIEPPMPSSSRATASAAHRLAAHLSLNATYLDPSVELRKQFGAAAVRAFESGGGGAGGADAARGAGGAAAARARAQSSNLNLKVRSLLVQPSENWPPIARTVTGIEMKVERRGEATFGSAPRCWWEHSRAYRDAQRQFLGVVNSFDPDALIAMLRVFPWHIDTLLQLSEVSRHQGDLGQASDFNSRALFAYERTAAPGFLKSFISTASGGVASTTSHPHPMPAFELVENRAFYLAAHRHVGFLGRRGTWRTALEWTKLVLRLDASDPHGMLCWIDFLAIKSRSHAWFREFVPRLAEVRAAEMLERGQVVVPARTCIDAEAKQAGLLGADKDDDPKRSLDWSVGLAFATALALRAEETERGEKDTGDEVDAPLSTTALRLAIARHPYAIIPLFAKLGVPLPPNVTEHVYFAAPNISDTQRLLALLYAHRSESLWKDAAVGAWLQRVLNGLVPTLCAAAPSLYTPAITDGRSAEGVQRHVIAADIPDTLREQLLRLFPRDVLRDPSTMASYDPRPPRVGATHYDEAYFAHLSVGRRGSASTPDTDAADSALARTHLAPLGALLAGLDPADAAQNLADMEAQFAVPGLGVQILGALRGAGALAARQVETILGHIRMGDGEEEEGGVPGAWEDEEEGEGY